MDRRGIPIGHAVDLLPGAQSNEILIALCFDFRMKIRAALLLSVLLGAVSALFPVILAIYLSWTTALSNENARLTDLGQQVIRRTELGFGEISSVLRSLIRMDLQPCSPAHISEMRRNAINSLFIAEIGYVEAGILRCTSWGVTEVEVRQAPRDFETLDGLAVVTGVTPVVTGGKPVMALRRGNYNALVSPARIVDILAEKNLRIAIAHKSGTMLAARDPESASLMRTARAGNQDPGSRDLILVAVPAGEWIAALAEPSTEARNAYARQLLLFVPIGAIIGGFAGGAVYWFTRKRFSAAGELSLAVRRKELVVHYQPIIALRTGECRGAEALARWRKEDGSVIGPEVFFPVAEEAGLIQEITDQVVRNVILDLGSALRSNRQFHVSINFSAADIQSGRAVELLAASLEGTGIEPAQIWLEATERSFMDVNPARSAIAHARSMGHKVLIDDFGTGYSSLQYLSDLPIDGLKIDRSFVASIGQEAATSSVIPHIIRMAKDLDLLMIAEGVERPEQARYLTDHGVDYAQGWLYSAALPASDFLSILSQDRSLAAC